MAVTEQRLRADAARNRQKILDAARNAFNSDGIDVSMAEIARQAGVGFATAQRRFPTKDDLIREIIAEELAGLRDPSPSSDPWDAFSAAVRTCAAHQASHPGLAGAIADRVSTAALSGSADHIASLFAAVTRQATEDGKLRPDATLYDVLSILKGNAGVIAYSPGAELAASARFVELALRGLQADRT